MTSKSILIISSYNVSKLVYFMIHSVVDHTIEQSLLRCGRVRSWYWYSLSTLRSQSLDLQL